MEVDVILVAEIEDQAIAQSELDEMWSFVDSKGNQRWLWHALDRRSGQVLAYVFGRRKDEVFLKLKQLLEGFGIQKFCSDGWGAYERHLCPEVHEIGKRKIQQIERKHLRLRGSLKSRKAPKGIICE